MSDFKLPDLPSDEELGITDEDRKFLEEADGPEMTDEEMRLLLGDSTKPPPAPAPPAGAKAGKAKKPKADKAKQAAGPGLFRRLLGGRKARASKAGAPSAGAPAAKPAARPSPPAPAAARSAAPPAAPAPAARGRPAAGTPTAKPPAGDGGRGGKDGDEGREAKAPRPRPPEAEGERSRVRGPLTLGVLLAVVGVASSRTGLPNPAPASAPDTAFSSARAMVHLVEIARAAHPPGSPEHDVVRAYLVEQLEDLGLAPEVQTSSVTRTAGTGVRGATVRNVLARLPGAESTGAVLLTAHYDGREVSRAAGDDGSGVVTILEALRAIRAGPELKNDVIVLFTDAEELGLLGATAFVNEHPWMADVRLVLSFEMRGAGGPSIMFETGEDNGWVLRALKASDPAPFANSLSYEVYRRLPNDTDFTPFRQAGVQGLNFGTIDRAHVYHQEYDSPERLDEATLQHHGLRAVAVTRYLGNQNLTSVDAPNVVYFAVPFLGLFVYDAGWVLPAAGGVLLAVVLALLVAARIGARVWAVLVGFGVSIVGASLAFGAGTGLLRWLPRFHPEMGSLHGSAFHSEGWYVLSLVAAAFVIVTATHALARRWLANVELSLGALLLPLGGALWLSASMPLAAMNLQVPVTAAALAAVVLAATGARWGGRVAWAAGLVLAVPVLVMLTPVLELLWISLSFRMAPAIAVGAALTLSLLLPALDGLRHPNSWWAPAAGLVVGGAALGVGLLLARPAAERPAPSTLLYAYDHASEEALWVTDASADTVDRVARAWASERAGGPFAETRDLASWGYARGEALVAPAPAADPAEPVAIVIADTVAAGRRSVVLGVRSQVGAERLLFRSPEGGRTLIRSINGRDIATAEEPRWVDHWGRPEGLVVLGLEMPADAPIELEIVEHLLRPESLLGDRSFERPPHLAPDITRQSDRAMLRTTVEALRADPRHAAGPPRTEALSEELRAIVERIRSGRPPARDTAAAPMSGVDAAPVGPDPAAPAAPTASDTSAVMRDTTAVARDTTLARDTLRAGGPLVR